MPFPGDVVIASEAVEEHECEAEHLPGEVEGALGEAHLGRQLGHEVGHVGGRHRGSRQVCQGKGRKK